MPFTYTEDHKTKLISLRERDGLSFPEIAGIMAEKYKYPFTDSAVRNAYNYYKDKFPEHLDMENLAKLHRAKTSARDANRNMQKALDSIITAQDVLAAIKETVVKLPKIKVPKVSVKKESRGKPMTVEMLFSDLQIGKLMDGYNTEIAKRRVKEYTRASLFKIQQHQSAGYKVERIVLALLGDIMEGSEKHPNSMRATDKSDPGQIQDSIETIFLDVIVPLAQLKLKVDIIGIVGNHDWSNHGISLYKPGKEQYTWVIYNTLKLLCETAGFTNVAFTIPEGAYGTQEIYGHTYIYEHGVGVKAEQKSMEDKLHKRARQLKKYVSGLRIGDKHHICRFNNDTMTINGSFFGDDTHASEFSGIMGYNSSPAQLLLFHVPHEAGDPRSSVYDSFVIQLGHIK